MRTGLTPLGCIEARVDDETVQPSRELCAASKLREANTDFGERLLRCVVCIVRIAQDAPREPFNARPVATEQRVERAHVAVLRALHEHRIAELVVDERTRRTRLERDRTTFSHRASLDPVSELTPEAVVPLLRGRFGTPYRYLPECASTQRLLGEDDPEGAVAATDHQTEGRGRLGRSWEDVPRRSILMSVLLRPDAPMPLWPELSLVAGQAVADALRSAGVEASLRHPNDVVVGGRKLVGVLPEASPGRVVLGIGVNVNHTADELPRETAKPPTSLRLELGHEVERAPLLTEILVRLELGYGAWLARHRR